MHPLCAFSAEYYCWKKFNCVVQKWQRQFLYFLYHIIIVIGQLSLTNHPTIHPNTSHECRIAYFYPDNTSHKVICPLLYKMWPLLMTTTKVCIPLSLAHGYYSAYWLRDVVLANSFYMHNIKYSVLGCTMKHTYINTLLELADITYTMLCNMSI